MSIGGTYLKFPCPVCGGADVFDPANERVKVLEEAQAKIRAMIDAMAEDDGLWFVAETAAEAYLQQELRKLCALIEGISPEDCAIAALQHDPQEEGNGKG
jgi:hypothetical protein